MKKKFYMSWWFWAIVVVLVIGVIGPGGEDPVNESEPVDNTPITNDVPRTVENKEVEPELTAEEKAEMAIVDAVKEKSNKKKDRIVNIEMNNNIIAAELNADEYFTVNRTRDVMLLNSAELFQSLFASTAAEEVSLTWILPLEDTQGNINDREVLKITLTKDASNKINWKNFSPYNFPDVGEIFWEHQAIRE